MDDGSDPPIPHPPNMRYPLKIVQTFDDRPWSQPCARNAGARIARGEYLFMTDIDHVISKNAFIASIFFEGDKMVFPRKWAILDNRFRIRQDIEILSGYGLINGKGSGSHANTFVMKKKIFDELGGYNENFCGRRAPLFGEVRAVGSGTADLCISGAQTGY
jgi:hypothetical protein